MLKIENINKNFDLNPILKDISFNINMSKIIQIAGENGSGKTTLLKIIAGLLKPEKGTITIDNQICKDYYFKYKKKIIYWGHQPLIYPNLTTLENIRFFLNLRNQNIPQNIDSILEEVQLASLKNEKCYKYSL